jgi:hypothetical protein
MAQNDLQLLPFQSQGLYNDIRRWLNHLLRNNGWLERGVLTYRESDLRYIHGTYMVHTWYIHGTYMVHTWYIHGTYMVHTWYIHGTYIGTYIHTWYIHGTYIGTYIHGTYMVHT